MHIVDLRSLVAADVAGYEMVAVWRVVEVEHREDALLVTVDKRTEVPGSEPLVVLQRPGDISLNAVIWWRDDYWDAGCGQMRLLVTGQYYATGYYYAPYIPLLHSPTVTVKSGEVAERF